MNIIVMTGGTSVLGEVAAKRFIQTPNTRLLLGAPGRGPPGAETHPLDLMRLESVRHQWSPGNSGRPKSIPLC